MSSYTFKFKPTSEIKDKFRTICVEAKDEKAAKKKLLKELLKANSDSIDVIKTEDYYYNMYMRLDLKLLMRDLQLVADFYPNETAASAVFIEDVCNVAEYLQENIVEEIDE